MRSKPTESDEEGLSEQKLRSRRKARSSPWTLHLQCFHLSMPPGCESALYPRSLIAITLCCVYTCPLLRVRVASFTYEARSLECLHCGQNEPKKALATSSHAFKCPYTI